MRFKSIIKSLLSEMSDYQKRHLAIIIAASEIEVYEHVSAADEKAINEIIDVVGGFAVNAYSDCGDYFYIDLVHDIERPEEPDYSKYDEDDPLGLLETENKIKELGGWEL